MSEATDIMDMLWPKCEVYKGGFGDYAKNLFDKPELSDVAIVLDNDEGDEESTSEPTRTFHGHRAILATMSDYFRSMLFGSFEEASKKEIRLPGVPYSVFVELMRYVYCGWTSPDEMNLEEVVEFYSLARMLLLDAKMKPCLEEWIAGKVQEWEKDLLKLLSLAFEWDMAKLRLESFERFCIIANDCLASSSFVELPLQVVQYIVGNGMNCTKAELIAAYQAWIKHHEKEIDADIIADLNKELDKCWDPLYDDFEFAEQSLYPEEDQQSWEVPPRKIKRLKPLASILNAPQMYSYDTEFRMNRDCITLKGIKICLRPNEQYGTEYARTKSEFELNFKLKVFAHRCLRDDECRNVTVRYDFTQHERVPVTIFFPQVDCCMGNRVICKFQWTGVGVQPLLQEYAAINDKEGTLLAKASYVSHMIYEIKNVYTNDGRCKKCPWF